MSNTCWHYRSQEKELKFSTELADRRRYGEEIDPSKKLARRETYARVETACAKGGNKKTLQRHLE
jgi:hypothetical protein